jgi:hypothetical protein
MTALDFDAIEQELTLTGMERVAAIDQMRANPRWPAVDADKRAARIPVLRQAVVVARALRACPEAQKLIIERLGE